MSALATKVVAFGGDSAAAAAAGVAIILDAAANINADGTEKTEFAPGEPMYLLVIVPDTWRLLDVKSTSGTVSALGQVFRTQIEERRLFAEAAKKEALSQLPAGPVAAKWYGREANLTVDGRELAASLVPSLADLTYEYEAMQYRLDAPAGLALGVDEEWPVGVVVYVEEIKKS